MLGGRVVTLDHLAALAPSPLWLLAVPYVAWILCRLLLPPNHPGR